MARRRKTRTRRATSRNPFRARTRRAAVSNKVQAIQFDAMIYGGARGYLSNMLAPIVSKIPLGNVADEIAFGALNYFVAKNTKGFIRNVALKGLVIENARLGEAVATGQLGLLRASGSGADVEQNAFIIG